MPLRAIIWNGLYSAQLAKRAEVRVRIKAHDKREKLGKWGVAIMDVRCVSI